MKEKALTDNLRVLVKPVSTPRKYVDEISTESRPISPFRVLKSRSNAPNTSHWRHPKQETQDERRMKLHESEISIFQQLCLDKHDENAAIEILLDSTESTIPEINTAPSEGTDHGSRGNKNGSVEGKRKFFDRLFKSNRRSQNQSVSSTEFWSSSKESNVSTSHSSNASDEPSLPTSPSSIPTTRITVENTFPEKSNIDWTGTAGKAKVAPKIENTVQKTRSFLDDRNKFSKTRSFLDDIREGGDTVSNISTLSGSLFTPVNLDRHESLGFESILDIRKCLIEMERQLGQATNKGQRVSRDKVMRALFTVADSLEDADEKSHLKKQLQASMETKTEATKRPATSEPPTRYRSDDERSELESSNEEDFTLDSGTLFDDDDEDSGTADSPLNIVSSVGEFFGVDKEGQHAVAEVLDDLLWTEFVSARQQKTSKKKGKGNRNRSSTRSRINRKSSEQREEKKSNTRKDRPWWRNHRLKEKVDYGDEEEDDDEFDEYSTSSSEDEFKTYLPTSITVKRKMKKPTKLEDAFPRSFSTPHGKVKLVDTESRLGYEMNYTRRRSPVM